MLHREELILYNVLNNETVFEEYFCNLLSIDEFRNLFIEFVSKKNSILEDSNIEYKHFDTEFDLGTKTDLDKYGRADLFLKIDNKEFIFEIKNKERTSLTDNQPTSYLEYLKNNNQLEINKHLFFLIPKYYKHKQETIDRWNLFDCNFNGIENQFLYWEDFIYELKENIEEQKTEIKMFYDFCMYWFNMKTVEFEENEMKLLKDKSLPSLVQKLLYITEDIGLEVGLNDKLETLGFSANKKINDYILYFGIDYHIWETNNTPLNIFIQNHKKDYQEFELSIEGINLEKIKWEENSVEDMQFGYVVILDDFIGSSSFELTVKDTINHIIKKLKTKN